MISRLRASFSSIASTERGRTRFTATFYSSLFAEHPEYRAFFPAALDQLRHRLFQAFTFVIDNLDDADRVHGFLAQLGRDHRKYGVEGRHYLAAGNALLTAAETSCLSSAHAIWTPSSTTDWSQLIDLLLHTMAEAADDDDFPAVWGATVVSHERRLDDLAIVRLETDSPIPYAAGQYLSVQIPQRPRMWRYLSPAIPANPFGQLEFHVRRVSGGWVSPAVVTETRVGDRWLLSSPLGGLEVDRSSGRDVLMIGSGTGIAPFRAQVMEMAARADNPRVHLFVGGTYPRDLYDLDTLWALTRQNPWLTVVPVTEEEQDPWWHRVPAREIPPGLHQRLHGRLGRVVAQFGSWADRQIQVSGSPTMIKTTVYALQAGGTPAELIKHDPLV